MNFIITVLIIAIQMTLAGYNAVTIDCMPKENSHHCVVTIDIPYDSVHDAMMKDKEMKSRIDAKLYRCADCLDY